MSDTQDLLARRSNAIAAGAALQNPFFAQKARNAEIWDIEGNRLIDFPAGIAVNNTGHSHPKVIAAVREQLDLFSHTCQHVICYEALVDVAEQLNARVPGDFDKKTSFVTTGVEAVENAIKVARYKTGRSAVIAFSGGFHGRSFMGMTLCGKTKPYKHGYGSLMPDVYHVPFPCDLYEISTQDTKFALSQLFSGKCAPARCCGHNH